MKIIDTSSIICVLTEINTPKIFDICIKSGYKLITTKQVLEELLKNPITIKKFYSYGKFIIDEVEDNCIDTINKRYPWMHKGELSVICYANECIKNRLKYRCIIDERARKRRDELGLKINGLVGLIKWERSLKKLTHNECVELYDKFKKSKFHIKDEVLREILHD